jgi:hypothetical protein
MSGYRRRVTGLNWLKRAPVGAPELREMEDEPEEEDEPEPEPEPPESD